MNEFRVGFNRFRLDYTADQFARAAALGNQLGVPNANVTPARAEPSHLFAVELHRHRPDAFAADLPAREHLPILDNMSYDAWASTRLKWGVDFRRRQLTIYQTNQGNGRFNFSPAFTDSRSQGTGGDSMASFLLGYPTAASSTTTRSTGRASAASNSAFIRRRLAHHQEADSQSRPALGLLQPFQ